MSRSITTDPELPSDIHEGVEKGGQSYPSANRIHGASSEHESTSRTIGPALKALESLEVIGLWSGSVGTNRYDLTEYDRDRSAALEEFLEE